MQNTFVGATQALVALWYVAERSGAASALKHARCLLGAREVSYNDRPASSSVRWRQGERKQVRALLPSVYLCRWDAKKAVETGNVRALHTPPVVYVVGIQRNWEGHEESYRLVAVPVTPPAPFQHPHPSPGVVVVDIQNPRALHSFSLFFTHAQPFSHSSCTHTKQNLKVLYGTARRQTLLSTFHHPLQ